MIKPQNLAEPLLRTVSKEATFPKHLFTSLLTIYTCPWARSADISIPNAFNDLRSGLWGQPGSEPQKRKPHCWDRGFHRLQGKMCGSSHKSWFPWHGPKNKPVLGLDQSDFWHKSRGDSMKPSGSKKKTESETTIHHLSSWYPANNRKFQTNDYLNATLHAMYHHWTEY